MSVDFKSSRSNFFRSFNSIFSKISKADETVIVSLIKSHCIPTLMYGLEALDLNKTLLRRLDNPLFLVFGKMFKTFDKNIVNCCMNYLNTLPLSFEYLIRKASFLAKLKMVENNALSKLYKVCGRGEFVDLYKEMKLDPMSNIVIFKQKVWVRFEELMR